MDITKLTGYFHDGSVIDIEHIHNTLTFVLESCQIHQEELGNNTILSQTNTLRGKLIINNIKSITVGHRPQASTLKKTYDDGDILDLEINPGKVKLLVQWVNYPPKPREKHTSLIEIDADAVQWENIPDLCVN